MAVATTDRRRLPGPLAQLVTRADRHMLALAAIVALAALLRFSTLDLQSYWFDETVTVFDTMRPGFLETVRGVAEMEVMPPLYFIVAWPWSKAFGLGEVGLRSLSALIGTLTVPVAYAVARHFLTRGGALAVAALTAVHPLLVWYSQEARAYALLILLGGLSFLFFLRALEARTPRAAAWWTLTALLALATHYFAAFLVGAEALWLVIAALRRPHTRGFRRATGLAAAALAAAGAALVPLAAHQANPSTVGWVDEVPLGQRLRELIQKFVAGPADPFGSDWLLELGLVAALVCLAYAVLRFRLGPAGRSGRGAAVALAVALAGPLGVFFLALAGEDYFHYRYLLVVWIPLVVGVAALLVPRPRVAAAIAALSCLVSLAIVVAGLFDESMQREDWRGAAAALGRPEVPRAVAVVPHWAGEPLQVYGQRVRPMPPAGYRVREIAVVGDADAWAASPPAALGGFRLVEHRNFNFLTVVRLRSRRSIRLSPAQLAPVLGVPVQSLRVQVPLR
jgi:mannosyltransferase